MRLQTQRRAKVQLMVKSTAVHKRATGELFKRLWRITVDNCLAPVQDVTWNTSTSMIDSLALCDSWTRTESGGGGGGGYMGGRFGLPASHVFVTARLNPVWLPAPS